MSENKVGTIISILPAIFTSLAVIAALLVPYIENIFRKQVIEEKETAVYRTDVDVKILADNMVLFSAYIENIGDKRIVTRISNLYFDQGIPTVLANDRETDSSNVVLYKFPFILEHKEVNPDPAGKPHCILCKKCSTDKDYRYPEEIVDNAYNDTELFRAHIELEHLSPKSTKYILPKEKFSEDVVLQFQNKGVYRVIFFVTCSGDEFDCVCATKQFYIPETIKTKQPIAVDRRTPRTQREGDT